jgi:hypothetical protein
MVVWWMDWRKRGEARLCLVITSFLKPHTLLPLDSSLLHQSTSSNPTCHLLPTLHQASRIAKPLYLKRLAAISTESSNNSQYLTQLIPESLSYTTWQWFLKKHMINKLYELKRLRIECNCQSLISSTELTGSVTRVNPVQPVSQSVNENSVDKILLRNITCFLLLHTQ